MELLTTLAKIYLVMSGISAILMIGQERKPITPIQTIIGLFILAGFYYLISN